MAIWGYANSECPPENWPEQYPEGAGSSQSPVDIKGASFKVGVENLCFFAEWLFFDTELPLFIALF